MGFSENQNLQIGLKETKMSSQVNYSFFSLRSLIIKVFNQQMIHSELPKLDIYQLQIFKSLLIKKQLPLSLDLTLNKSSLNSIILTPLQKKREYSIKFVIMRSLDHIKQKFYKKKIKSKKLSLHKQSKFIKYEEICFYDYYFQEIAQKMNIPIESFYGFKNHTHRHNKNIPKSITKRVLSL